MARNTGGQAKKKKGEAGAAKNYIVGAEFGAAVWELGLIMPLKTRTQAIKKLQCSISDFRRLCILKGALFADITEELDMLKVYRHMRHAFINRHIPATTAQPQEGQQGINCSRFLLLCERRPIPPPRTRPAQAPRAQGICKEAVESCG